MICIFFSFGVDVNSRYSSGDFHHHFLCTLKPQAAPFFFSSCHLFYIGLIFFKNVLFFFFLPYSSFVSSYKYAQTSHNRSHQKRDEEREHTHTLDKEKKDFKFYSLLCSPFVCIEKKKCKENFDSFIQHTSKIILCPRHFILY